jgi:hypothetical protein
MLAIWVIVLTLLGTSCTVIKGVFEAGAWVGAVAVVVALGLLGGLGWLLSRAFRR